MQTSMKIIDPKQKQTKINYNKNKYTGKYETDEQHYYYLHGYLSIPFGVKRTSERVHTQILNHKKQLEKQGKIFPI